MKVIDDAKPGSGSFVAGGHRYRVEWAPSAGAPGGQTARFDPSSLRFPLELRAWLPGDRIRLDYGSKKLKKLLQERRVGLRRRGTVPVVVDSVGEVLWVPGVARSVLALPPADGSVLEITVRDGDSQ